MENKSFFVKNKSIITFLILEIVALTAFNFGNISYIFGIAGAVLALVAIPFVAQNTDEKKPLLWILLPIGILFLVSSIGSFNVFSNGFSTLTNISLFISLPAFFALGFFLRKLNDIKPKTVLLVIGAGLAAITFFGLASTVVEYGLFYSLIYKGTPNYYYGGEPFNVTEEMYWLKGFEFGEVFIEYGCLPAILCASFLVGLLFLSPRKDRNEFIICAAIGGVGLLTLLVIPNLKALIILIIVSSFAFVYKYFRNNKKVLKITGISFACIVGLGILFFVVALINAAIGFKFSGFLDRIFVSNGIMNNCKPVFESLFQNVGGKLVNFMGLRPTAVNGSTTLIETHIFEVQLLKEIGLIGTFVFIGFIVMMGYFLNLYLKKSDDEDHLKVILITMLLSYFVYESIANVITIAPHSDYYEAFLRSSSLLIIMFVFGYVYVLPEKKEKNHE